MHFQTGTAETTNTLCSDIITAPTPGQISLIESNSFTADKFVSKRSSKKWDVPPSQHNEKKAFTSKSSFDATAVDPSEFVPKVVPMCEVESAMGREGEMGVSEESGRDVVSIKQKNEDSTTELQVYSKTSDNGHSDKRTTSLQWTNCLPPAINCPHISTSDEGTTSQQWTKCLSPPCPLFRGSTV